MSTELSHRFVPCHIAKGLHQSTDVAFTIGRDHKNLLRDIRVLLTKHPELSPLFSESTYRDSKGRTRPCYYITLQGLAKLGGHLGIPEIVDALLETAFVAGERQALDREDKKLLLGARLTMQDKAYRDRERQMIEYQIQLTERIRELEHRLQAADISVPRSTHVAPCDVDTYNTPEFATVFSDIFGIAPAT